MKVVLFCGGFGMRMREYSESIPKPLVQIGNRPILWHIMKYYAHYGHTEFILCLGWKANAIKQYFLQYDECISNDFVLSSGGQNVDLLNRDIQDWKITFVDTGSHSNIGERLKAVEKHLDGEQEFLANYTDGLSDVHLPDAIDAFRNQQSTASFLSVRPTQSFHSVSCQPDGCVNEIIPIGKSGLRMNGGFFIFRNEFFDCLNHGEELIEEPFQRLISAGQLSTFAYDGFWSCMDTFKEKQDLDDLYSAGSPPWEVWKRSDRSPQARGLSVASPILEDSDT
ncbi:MAG: glucose-1-phosphate cytidylyltransferase, partial [Alphaproteobacteria bacterium]|nr:glucose-1-phosphate cytidylyltransferase [Alphaproteobacteria bacterium]